MTEDLLHGQLGTQLQLTPSLLTSLLADEDAERQTHGVPQVATYRMPCRHRFFFKSVSEEVRVWPLLTRWNSFAPGRPEKVVEGQPIKKHGFKHF